ncbi:MAG: low molecular weight phosphotyrosine protein phosphatase [Clostridia bacterium]|nr:low molecular weight phosphotyrosine protein phosphatase [Clostridia bacterium]
MQKIRINFVCHGNICRSPMAEYIFIHLIKMQGVTEKFEVTSSAVSSEEIYMGVGNPIYPPAKSKLEQKGIAYGDHKATQLQKSDYQKYDLFVCMDNSNVFRATRIFGADSENKVKLLMEYTAKGGEVADPWYSGDFEEAYNDIYAGCEALLLHLLQTKDLKK